MLLDLLPLLEEPEGAGPMAHHPDTRRRVRPRPIARPLPRLPEPVPLEHKYGRVEGVTVSTGSATGTKATEGAAIGTTTTSGRAAGYRIDEDTRRQEADDEEALLAILGFFDDDDVIVERDEHGRLLRVVTR